MQVSASVAKLLAERGFFAEPSQLFPNTMIRIRQGKEDGPAVNVPLCMLNTESLTALFLFGKSQRRLGELDGRAAVKSELLRLIGAQARPLEG